MRIILYTHDFEPITVLELPGIDKAFIHAGTYVVPVYRPSEFLDVECGYLLHPSRRVNFDIVTITMEWMVRREKRYPLFFTRDEESALLLKAALLPGQTKEFNEERARSFARGLIKGLQIASLYP
jgi:hypothetical protein